MNRQTLRVLLVHEFRMLLRDRRTIVFALLIPLILGPVIVFATKVMQDRRQKKLEEIDYRYAVTGSAAAELRAVLDRARQKSARGAGSDAEIPVAGFKFEEIKGVDPAAALRDRQIHVYLEALSGADADAVPTKEKPAAPDSANRSGPASPISSEEVRLPGVPLIRIYFHGDRDDSTGGLSRFRALLLAERRAERDALLADRGFPADPRSVLPLEENNVAGAGQEAGSYVGRFLTVFLLMLMLSGGSVAAMDSIAGEKERGSLETLLTTAAGRGEIVAAKQLVIATVAAVITLMQIGNLLVYVNFRLVELPKNFQLHVPPATLLILLALYLPLAAFLAALLLAISAYAKSYKEAMLYFFPVYLVCLAPALASFLPGISLRSAIVLVPLANVSVAVREIMVGKLDWVMIAATFAVMTGAAIWMVRNSVRMLSNERLITPGEFDVADISGGPALFTRHVWRWYALLAVLLFTIALNVPSLSTFRAQVLFNELVLFLGGALAMVLKYRLNPLEAFALRPVKPLVWPVALVLIPSGYITGLGIFRLADLVLPVPRRVLEEFGRELVPQGVPVWEMVVLLAVLPAICEEVAFRGTLLYALRRKFRPVPLALVIGIVFGLFHVALFRIVPTAFLGIALTAVALLTGSILPGMLIHAGNNAFGFWAGMHKYPLEALQWWQYLSAAAVFLLCFYVLYRERTPYPGLRQ